MYPRIYQRHLACYAAVFLAASSLSAQAPLALSSEQAVELAIENNPLFQAARSVVERARGRLQQAGLLDNPELGVSYSGDQAFNDEGEQSFGLAFSQRFPVTQRLQLEKAVARKEVEVAQAEINNEMRQLTQKVRLAVVALASTEAELELRDQLKSLNQEFLDFIESRVETGEASQVEADQLRIALYSVKQETTQLRHQLTVQKAAIRELMGVAPDFEFDLDYAFSPLPENPPLPDLDEAWLHAHPAYRLRQLLLQLAEGRIARALAGRWADVAVEVFYEEERGVDAPNGLGRDRFLGLGLSVPLPLHDRNAGNVAEQRAARNEMHWHLQATVSSLQIEASMRRELVDSLRQQALEYESEVMSLVDQNLEAMRDGYAKGQISLAELFQTQAQRLKIQSTHIQVLSELANAHIQWSAATGVDLPARAPAPNTLTN